MRVFLRVSGYAIVMRVQGLLTPYGASETSICRLVNHSLRTVHILRDSDLIFFFFSTPIQHLKHVLELAD